MSKLRNALIGAGALGGLAVVGVAAFPENEHVASAAMSNNDKTKILINDGFLQDFGLAQIATVNTRLFNMTTNQVCTKGKILFATDLFDFETTKEETCRPIQKGDLPHEFLEEVKKFRPPAPGLSRP